MGSPRICSGALTVIVIPSQHGRGLVPRPKGVGGRAQRGGQPDESYPLAAQPRGSAQKRLGEKGSRAVHTHTHTTAITQEACHLVATRCA
eukprot:scaffold9874_cov116-Isochrysis_galbana.AAC.2